MLILLTFNQPVDNDKRTTINSIFKDFSTSIKYQSNVVLIYSTNNLISKLNNYNPDLDIDCINLECTLEIIDNIV